MDVKTESGVEVNIQATKKPANASKLQELTAMEEALKKATEEAHRQRLALSGETETEAPETKSKAYQGLIQQQE
jgi:hypothetical protein